MNALWRERFLRSVGACFEKLKPLLQYNFLRRLNEITNAMNNPIRRTKFTANFSSVRAAVKVIVSKYFK